MATTDNVARKLWVCLEGQEQDQAAEIEVDGDSVSSLMQAIATSGYLTTLPVVDFESLTLEDQVLKPRQKLAALDIKDDSVFILKVKQQQKEDLDIVSDEPIGGRGGRGRGRGRGRRGRGGRGRGRGHWRYMRGSMTHVSDISAQDDMVETENLEGFSVARKDVFDKKTGEVSGKEVIVTLIDEDLTELLRDALDEPDLYKVKPRVNANYFVPFLPVLKECLEKQSDPATSPLKPFVDWLAKECQEITDKLEAMVKKGVMSFADLVLYFCKGKRVYVREDVFDQKVAFEINSTQYRSNFFGTFFSVTGNVVFTNGLKFFSVAKTFFIASFQGVRSLDDLPVKALDDESLHELTERGNKFKAFALGTHHLGYKGAVFRRSYYNLLVLKADGRVVVDGPSFKRMSPNYSNNNFIDAESEAGVGSPELNEDDLWCTWPFVYGFSFSAKKWGELNVAWMTPVQYEDKAFEQLVIPADKKELIKALVQYRNQGFSDIISNKGGGCIFLLHGSPGVGKTLTAESIAEFLHRPLYSVSVGELGTSTLYLEERLREILEIASVWDAVVLIDEADIFLEKRTEEDIKRNALVGIFLRLLEYHQGVLFLTTNRVKSFDPAFHSRISVALKYNDLDLATREKIWNTLLTAAGVKACTGKDFYEYELNGRQIKNCIRLSQALAASVKKEVDVDLIVRTIRVTLQFQVDLLDSIISEEAFEEIIKSEVLTGVQHKLKHEDGEPVNANV